MSPCQAPLCLSALCPQPMVVSTPAQRDRNGRPLYKGTQIQGALGSGQDGQERRCCHKFEVPNAAAGLRG